MDKLAVADPKTGANRRPRSLGMWAVLTGVVTPEQLQEAYAGWEERGEAPGEMFVRNGWMTEQMVADALGELSGLPVVKAVERSEDPDVLGALSAEEAWRLEACPIERDGEGNLVVALADPSDARLRALRQQLGSAICPVIVVNSQLKALLEGAQASGAEPDAAASSRDDASEDGGEAVGEAVTEAHDPEPSPQVEVESADHSDDAPEPVDPVPAASEPAEDSTSDTEQLERLHERLVSEHVQITDELVASRRQFTEFAGEQERVQVEQERVRQEQERLQQEQERAQQEQARLQQEQERVQQEQERVERGIAALEAELGEQELVLALIKAKLAGSA